MKLDLHFARYEPYHLARLASAREALAPLGWEVAGVETAGHDATYGWRSETAKGIDRISLTALTGNSLS